MAERHQSTGRVLRLLLVLLFLAALLPGLPLPDPLLVQLDERLLPPFSASHLLGTDDLGRDLLSRLLTGLSTNLLVSISATAAALAGGLLIGGVAGYFRTSWFDRLVTWVMNLILSLPFLLVMAGALSVVPRAGLWHAYGVLAAVMWVGPARVARAEVARQREQNYVLAARALGVPGWRILFGKLLPRAARPATALVYSYLPEIIALEAGLSFLGLGVQPPAPALGKMVFDGLPLLFAAWWLAIFPATALFLVVLSVNVAAFRRERPAWR